jgi:hypothetical protein
MLKDLPDFGLVLFSKAFQKAVRGRNKPATKVARGAYFPLYLIILEVDRRVVDASASLFVRS